MDKKKIDRLKFSVANNDTGESEMDIDMPSYFKIDTQKLWDVIIKELCKQEKKAKKL